MTQPSIPFYRTPEYRSWEAARDRCHNPKCHYYARYGGRGIFMCERWRQSFAAFLDDMQLRPSPDHSLDRFPDNNGPYAPENCRWATRKEQQRNMRSNRWVTVHGVTKVVAEWAEIQHMSKELISYRLDHGWEPALAVLVPPGHLRAPSSAK